MDKKMLDIAKKSYLSKGLDALLEEKDWGYLETFTKNWNIASTNFSKMLDDSLGAIKNFNGRGANGFSTVCMIGKKYPSKMKSAFTDLYNLSNGKTVGERVEDFRKCFDDPAIKSFLDSSGLAKIGKPYTIAQSNSIIVSYLWLKYPEKFYQYAYKVQQSAYYYLNGGTASLSEKNFKERYEEVTKFMDELKVELNADKTFMDEVKKKLATKGYDVNNTKLINHFAYWVSKIVKLSSTSSSSGTTTGVSGFDDGTASTDAIFKDINVSETLNIILYGPPGTGKTYNTKTLAVMMCDGKAPADYDDVCKRYKELVNKNRVKFITFHQSYSYEEFIGGMKATTKSGAIKYEFESGVFKKFCDDNRKKEHKCVFIIDEINRGNIAKIFGELITLIETSKREGMTEEASAILPYNKEKFSVPRNISIIGTMNTADKSITQLDTALRRRFDFIEMMPNYELLKGIDSDNDEISIQDMLMKMNKRIELLYDREHQIGHSYFMDLQSGFTLDELNQVFYKKIIPLLKEYFFDDYYKIQLVLGEFNPKKTNNFILKEDYDSDLFGTGVDTDDLPDCMYRVNAMKNINYDSYGMIYKDAVAVAVSTTGTATIETDVESVEVEPEKD